MLFRNFSIYTFTTTLNSAIPFLLLPILTSYLSPFDYGQMSLMQIIISFALPFVHVNVPGAINIAYFRIDKKNMASYVSSSLIISIAGFVCVLFFLGGGSDLVARLAKVPPKWVMIAPVFAIIQVISMTVLVIFQAKELPLSYAKYLISQTMLNFGLSMLFVVALHSGWEGRLYGIFLSYATYSVIGLWLLNRMGYLTANFKMQYVRDALKFGVPLIPHTLGAMLMMMADRFLISHMVSVEAAGVYSVGFQLASIMLIIGSSVNQAWSPYLFRNLSEITSKKKKKIVKISYMIFGLLIVAWVSLWIVTPFLFKIFINVKYVKASEYVFWISLAFMCNGMYFVVTNYISFEKKTHLLSILTFSNAIMSIGLSYMLIPVYGAMGAAYSTAISWFVFFIISWALSNRVYPMPWFSWGVQRA